MDRVVTNGVIYDADYGQPDLWPGNPVEERKEDKSEVIEISKQLYERLKYLGIVGSGNVRSGNVGASDYAKHIIQPWTVWLDYGLNPWDADIIKRVLRTKAEPGKSSTESRILDYEKIIHICQERIRQLNG